MTEMLLYTVFQTDWGHFGLAGTTRGLVCSHLPARDSETVRMNPAGHSAQAEFSAGLFKPLQEQIKAYFQGISTNFNTHIDLLLDGFKPFEKAVLRACRTIKFGQKVTYKQLATIADYPCAARAAANVMAKNPLPLIVPCHRVIKSNGQIGGFSATTDAATKAKLLELEHIYPTRV